MSRVIDALDRVLGARLSVDPEMRKKYRRDYSMLAELREFQDREGPLPQAVVEAQSVKDVSDCLRICRDEKTPVVTVGGASGVCCGIQPGAEAVMLSTRGLSGLVRMESDDLTATFRAGTFGQAAEDRVREAGLTIGHWPQSIELSTVGGWVATRASGQYSTAYGNIEDMVLALEAVLPDGKVVRTRETPRASAGPDLKQFFLGSEGTLGVVTEVTFSLRPLPESSRGSAFHFPDFHSGVELLRQIMRPGWRPPVVRLYDAAESARHFDEATPEGRSMLVLLHEGPASAVQAEMQAIEALCRSGGGEASDPAVVDHWLEGRNRVPSFRSFLENGIIVDTIEVASTWNRVVPVYESVKKSLSEVPGLLLASAHSSHSYRSGTNLYITFAVRPDTPSELESSYLECWKRTMEAAAACGAGIAHHHGVGRVRRDYLASEVGDEGIALLRSVKRALDPDGLLNPGNLLPVATD